MTVCEGFRVSEFAQRQLARVVFRPASARSQNSGKTTIDPSQVQKWVPPPEHRHYPRRVESSTRARALRARETRPRRRGVEVSPPFLRTLAASAGRAPI